MTPAAVAVIRADALRNNLRRVRESAPGCRVLAVIKADAYGHGLLTVARILGAADGYAVARLEEGLRLREAGLDRRVVILGGFVTAEEAREAAAGRFDVVIHSVEQVRILESIGDRPPVDLWIKVDTGMGRLGIEVADVPEVLRRLNALGVSPSALRLMTHLACADEAGGDRTTAQLERFAGLAGAWAGDLSVANSAAILQWPASWRHAGPAAGGVSWVRPGLMLYGASPVAGRSAADLGLQPVMSFETRLIAVRHIPRGRSVGYGAAWVADRDSVIGVAAAGYADGYPWHTARDTQVLVNGRRAPVIGRVSMDMISIDLTGLPPALPGDRVVLWGDGLPVDEVAARTGTIAYELLAGMSPRVVRRLEDRG